MAFDTKTLRTETLGPGMVRAMYRTNETQANIEATGYFNAAYVQLPLFTVIDMLLDLDGTPVFATYWVTASSASGVTIALQKVTASS